MPGRVLSEPGVALFGKLPMAGDFVSRGLPPGTRAALDRWLTAHLALRSRAPAVWPPGGLRGTLVFGGQSLSALILPSSDRAGRAFPLACCHLPGLSWDAAEEWCDAALPSARAAVAGALSPDTLWSALAALPEPDLDPAEPGLWSADPPDPDAPAEVALAALMGPLRFDPLSSG